MATQVQSTGASTGVAAVQPKTATETAAAKLIDSARKHLGEPEGPNNQNPYTAHVAGNAHLPWCAAFVSTMLEKQNIPGVSGKGNMFSASCAQLAGQFKSAGRYSPAGAGGRPPQPGDVIFFGSPEHHTGIVEAVKDGKVYTVEGNSSDKVSERSYDLNDPHISGYGKVFTQPVSGDLGFDTKGATRGVSGGTPSARAQGRGTATRATETGLEPMAYSHFEWRVLLRLIEAMLNGDVEALQAALADALPYVSQEDLAALAQTLKDNPELANLMATNPQETAEALLADSSPKAVKALLTNMPLKMPSRTEAASDDVHNLLNGLLNSSVLKNRPAAFVAMQPFMQYVAHTPKPPPPPSWSPPDASGAWNR